MGKKKQPATDVAFSATAKKPSAEPDDPGKRKPVWKFAIMDFDGPFSCGALTGDKIKEIHGKLSDFESMTWNEIEKNRHHHFMPPAAVCKTAQDRLEAIGQDDADNLFSLRLTGKERVWGIRDRHVYKILWWDPNHQVYPVAKKGT